MKKFSPLLITGVIVLLIASWIGGSYNSIVQKKVSVDSSWAQVENTFQSRFDLVPQLVSTVKGAANFEQETLTQVTEARTAWMNASTREEKIEASNQNDSALARLLVTVEAYPQLTATAGFQTLQAQIEGIENRLRVARRDYVEITKDYNASISMVPKNIIANMFGFKPEPYFTATEGSETAPVIDFSK